jgi:hypothetical protein
MQNIENLRIENEGAFSQSPEPIGFFNFGISYLTVARNSCGLDIRFSDPVEFLFSHAAELFFKADLLRHLEITEIKKKYGHRLEHLYRDTSEEFKEKFCRKKNFLELVKYLNEGHSGKDVRNRYLVVGSRKALPVGIISDYFEYFTDNDRKWLLSHFCKASKK